MKIEYASDDILHTKDLITLHYEGLDIRTNNTEWEYLCDADGNVLHLGDHVFEKYKTI